MGGSSSSSNANTNTITISTHRVVGNNINSTINTARTTTMFGEGLIPGMGSPRRHGMGSLPRRHNTATKCLQQY